VIVPPAVVDELAEGRALGVNLPDLRALDWVSVRRPGSEVAVPLVTNLGRGETETLMLALESREATVVLDDALARGAMVNEGLCKSGGEAMPGPKSELSLQLAESGRVQSPRIAAQVSFCSGT
jgi:predicted nucleic acid-binding protein